MDDWEAVSNLRRQSRHFLAPTVREKRWDEQADVWEFEGTAFGVVCQISRATSVWVVGLQPGGLTTEVSAASDLISRFIATFDRAPVFAVKSHIGILPTGEWIEIGDVVLSFGPPTGFDRLLTRLPFYERRGHRSAVDNSQDSAFTQPTSAAPRVEP